MTGSLASLARRELTLAVRDAGLRYALLGYLAALLVALVTCYLGTVGVNSTGPETMGRLLSSRLTAIQWVLSCALAPWAMLRLGGQKQGDSLVRFVALSRCRPWQVVLVRWGVGYLYLLQLLITSLPVVLLACVISTAPPTVIIGVVLDLVLFLGLVVPAVLHWTLECRPGLPTLGLSYLTLLVLAVGRWRLLEVAGRAAVLVATLTAVLGLGGWLTYRSSRRLLYLHDGTPR